MLAIETRGLSKVYLRRKVVGGLNMHVEQGDIYGFVGRNGEGKSTTMKMICGMIRPTAGEVRLFDRLAVDPTGNVEHGEAVRIGALVESPGLYPNMSAFENMRCKAIALGLVDGKAEIEQLLSIVGLSDAGRKRMEDYSMGMKQRLGLALAMLGSPDVLLLDEPMNGLDPDGVREVRNLIIRLNEQRGVTVVVSSHVLDQLGRIATRYGVINAGRMVCEMTADEVAQACGDYLVVRTAEPERTLALLAETYPNVVCTMLPEGTLRLQDAARERAVLDAAMIGAFLAANNIPVYELRVHERDLEDYFLELMGGGDTHA
ncbi:ATP-binding cassette domain-containing protein [Eggerthella timonensis]|uniref:ATP-binding cassette domain-containing protein n=1 Tax=Eggerthella timonensis TaxID=1871008 RepID=UPI000C7839CB|nr:ATP-binding cassette domain-containing protein [Eggerthella timonensis]